MEEVTFWCGGGNLRSMKVGPFHFGGFQNHVAADGSLLGVSDKWVRVRMASDGANVWNVRHARRRP